VQTSLTTHYPIKPINLNDNRKKIHVALIGLGHWGRNVLLPKLKSFRAPQSVAKVDNIYLYDINQSNISEFDGKGKIALLDSFDAIANQADIDALVIATPDDTHYDLVKRAIHHGKHVFVEKCFVRSTEQAHELVNLAEKNNLRLMVGYQYMFDRRFIALKKLLDSGKLGRVEEMTVHLMNKYVPASSDSWGDSTIIEHHSSHQFSIFQLLLGNHLPTNIQIHEALEDYVSASMNYRNVLVNFTTAINYPSKENYRHITIKGSRFIVTLDFSSNSAEFKLKYTQNNENIERNDPSYPKEFCHLGDDDSVDAELLYFSKLINNNAVDVSGGATAVHMLELVTLMNTNYLMHRNKTAMVSADGQRQYTISLNSAIDHVFRHKGVSSQERETLRILSDKVIDILLRKPYSLAKDVCSELGIDHEQIKSIYKIIQCSQEAQKVLRGDSNFDYFSVVDAFFNRQQYEATFFVGIVCPYKCTFCKMQMTAAPVPLDTPRFEHRKSDLINVDVIDTTVQQIAQLNRNGKRVSVKISGGLEPLTDMMRVSAIANSAFKHSLPVKLYTNGVLIDSQEKRDLLLKFNDVRISLNTINEKKYREVYLDSASGNKSRTTLSKLIGLIERLVQDKEHDQSSTRIGFNFVVIRETIEDMESMSVLAANIGLDYINYNIDYFDSFSDKEFIAIKENIKLLRRLSSEGILGKLKINFGGSLLRDNLFTEKPKGQLDPTEIRKHKVFIEPSGNVTPIHEGTFAFRAMDNKSETNPYVLDRLGPSYDFNAVVKSDRRLANIGYDYLAPLELILASEMIRLREDKKMGLEESHSPYNTRYHHIPI